MKTIFIAFSLYPVTASTTTARVIQASVLFRQEPRRYLQNAKSTTPRKHCCLPLQKRVLHKKPVSLSCMDPLKNDPYFRATAGNRLAMIHQHNPQRYRLQQFPNTPGGKRVGAISVGIILYIQDGVTPLRGLTR